MSKKLNSFTGANAPTCSLSSDTPETDAAEGYKTANMEWIKGVPWTLTEGWVHAKISRKIERERNALAAALRKTVAILNHSDTDSTLSDAIEKVRKYEWTNAARIAVDLIPVGDLPSAFDWTATYLVELERRLSAENAATHAPGANEKPLK